MADRTLIIGIDGGDPEVIKKWVNDGELPNFAKIINKGSFGKLRSTIPPITGAAWSSFQTGTNPGKHGAFNWFKRVKGEYRSAPVNTTDISEPTLWDILSKYEKKVGVLGVPVTYPVNETNGFLIPGLLTPPNAKTQSYPSDLINEIKEIEPDFKFSPKEWTRGYKPKDWVEELIDDIGVKERLSLHLMREKAWDFMMIHFMETDQVQHFMWHKKGGEDWCPILQVYKRIDKALGILTDELDEEDSLFIMSDHGFGPLRYNFHIDTWLLKEGYMKFRNNIPTLLKRMGFMLGLTKEAFYPVGEYIYPIMRKAGLLGTAIELASHPWLEWLFLSSQNVNWKKTMAYTHSEIGHIYLNVNGREPRGAIEPEDVPAVRDEIIARLKELKNPYTGKKIAGEIYVGQELYHGDKTNMAPDIVFLPADMEILGKGAYEFLAHKIVTKSRSQSGHHRMDGIFLAMGPDIKANNLVEGPHIMDIAPTVLYRQNLPLLKSMDGKVIESIFTEEYLAEHEIEYVNKEDLGLDKNNKNESNEEEEKEMKKRLKGLGYVS